MRADGPFRVLVLCTGNSARSILGEALLNHHGDGRIVGLSAGSQPKAFPHPAALAVLSAYDHPTLGLHSKSWSSFAADGAPDVDLVITVCDNAAGEACPVFPGSPQTVHWGLADPAAADGDAAQILAAFETTYAELDNRIQALCALDDAALYGPELAQTLAAIHAGA